MEGVWVVDAGHLCSFSKFLIKIFVLPLCVLN